jgi:carbonic anhydrase
MAFCGSSKLYRQPYFCRIIFDQGLGDIFSIRIAGNFVNQDILRFYGIGCNVAGSKLIVVLGHTKCGALKEVLMQHKLKDGNG